MFIFSSLVVNVGIGIDCALYPSFPFSVPGVLDCEYHLGIREALWEDPITVFCGMIHATPVRTATPVSVPTVIRCLI
jgi:hypothetical protein